MGSDVRPAYLTILYYSVVTKISFSHTLVWEIRGRIINLALLSRLVKKLATLPFGSKRFPTLLRALGVEDSRYAL